MVQAGRSRATPRCSLHEVSTLPPLSIGEATAYFPLQSVSNIFYWSIVEKKIGFGQYVWGMKSALGGKFYGNRWELPYLQHYFAEVGVAFHVAMGLGHLL